MADTDILNPYERIWKTRDLRALETPIELENNTSQFGRGLNAFGKEMQATGYGLAALGAQGLENVIGENAVTSGITDWGVEGYKKAIDESQSGYNAPNVADVSNIKGVGDFTDWASYQLGKGLPMLGSLVLSGGVGGAVARLTAKEGIKQIAKGAVGSAVKKGVETKALQAAEGQIITKTMQEAAAKALRDRVVAGTMTGGFTGSFGLEGGLAFGEQVEAGVKPKDAVKSAIAVGGINGALEFLPFYGVAKSIGMGQYAKNSIKAIIKNDAGLSKKAVALATAKELGGRALKGGLVGAGAEGITEGLQELTSIAGLRWAKQDPLFADLSDDDWNRVGNAMAAGALVGGVAAGAGSTLKGPGVTDNAPTGTNAPPAGTTAQPAVKTREQEIEAGLAKITTDLEAAKAAGDTKAIQELQQIKELYDAALGKQKPVLEPVLETPPNEQIQPVTEEQPILGTTEAQVQPPLEMPAGPEGTDGVREEGAGTETRPVEEVVQPTPGERIQLKRGEEIVLTPNGTPVRTTPTPEEVEALRQRMGPRPEKQPIEETANGQEVQAQTEAQVKGIPPLYSKPIGEVKSPNEEAVVTEATMEEFEAVRRQFQERQSQTPFKKWFGTGTPNITATKEGEPITLYHGTNNPAFFEWDSAKAGEASGHPTSGLGFFMTANPGAAARYGNNLLELHAKINNPYTLTDADLTRIETTQDAVQLRKRLMNKGYDGAVVTAPGASPYVIAFQGNQIKLKSNTAPTDSPDMRYSKPLQGREASAPFYSALERATQEVKQQKAPASQWLGTLDTMVKKGIIRQEELDWNGTREWLQDQKEPVTKDALLQHVKDNTLEVQETSLEEPRNTKWTLPDSKNQRELVLTVPSIEPFNTDTTHYGDVGGGRAVAWVRFNDRVDGDGNKTLFIEEIQSKRHQEGKEKGYQSSTADITDGVPNAPFKQSISGSSQTLSGWAGLAFKRMLRYAVENGYDKVAFTNGEQQAKRYKLQKHIKTIKSTRKPNNNYLVKTITYDDNIESSFIPAESIIEKVGKKFSDEIINSKESNLTFTDINLKIGGEKLKKLYDEILPTEINKYVKKWGAKVDKTQMEFGDKSASVHSVEITPAMRESVMQGQPLFSKQTGKQKIVTPEMDAEYLAAVERGDMETAQRMVDEAAKKAGYTVGPVWHHGGFNKEEDAVPNVGTEGMHFGTEQAAKERAYGKLVDDFIKEGEITFDEDLGAWFWSSQGIDSYDVANEDGYLSKDEAQKSLENFANWQDTDKDASELGSFTKAFLRAGDAIHVTDQKNSWNKAVAKAKSMDVGAISYKNLYEDKGSTSYIVFAPEQIKSADPITYDNAGNVIPLSQRFNEATPDIRYTQQPGTATIPLQDFQSNIDSIMGEGWLQQATEAGLVEVIEEEGPNGESGSWAGDRIRLYTGSMPKDGSPAGVLLHEGKHVTFEDVLGNSLPEYVKDLHTLADNGNKVAQDAITHATIAVADVLGIKHNLLEGGTKADLKNLRALIEQERPGLLAEEELAYFVQYGTDAQTGTGFWKRLINQIKAWFAQTRLGQRMKELGIGFEMTDTMAVEWAKMGLNRSLENLRQAEKARIQAEKQASTMPASARLGKALGMLEEIDPLYTLIKSGNEAAIKKEANLHEFYKKLAGETEARLTQARQKMTEGERQSTSPESMMDYPYGQQIVVMQGGNTEGNILYSMGIQEIREQLWNDPTDIRPEIVNKPGLLQKWRADFVDFFAEMEKKSKDIYDTYSLLRSKKAARVEQARQEYFLPLRKQIAESPWNSQEVGDMAAARHIKVDNVNTRLAQRASYGYTKELLKVLSTAKRKELMQARINVKAGKMPDGSVYLDANGNPAQMSARTKQQLMFDLMNKYSQHEITGADGIQTLREEWELFKDAAAGFSDGGVGSTKVRTVNDVLKLADKDRAKFDQIMTLFDAANRHALELLEDGELITAAEHARLLLDKSAYAPLRRESYKVDEEIARLFQRAGQGGSKQIATRAGTENLSEPTLVLQNALAAIEAAAAAAERNLANKELYKVIVKDRAGWKPWFTIVDKDKYVTHDEDGFLQEKNATASNRADITLINDGKKLVIRPNMHNERAVGFVRAVNNLDAQVINGPMKVLNWLNQIVRWVNVSASPIFLMTNAFKDPFTAFYNIKATEAEKYTKEIFNPKTYKDSFRALKKVFMDGNRDPTDPDVQWVEKWELAGGRTSFIETLRDMDETWKSFDKQVSRRKGTIFGINAPGFKSLMQAKDKWIDGLENFNVLFENVMRFSTFKVLMEHNAVSEAQAARISQDLTTNFTRRGYKTQALGTWWLFFNATVQGNYQVLRNLMSSKKVQAWVGGTVVMALLLDLLGRAVDDDWDKVSEWDKERFIILPIKVAGDFVRIPAPWVYNVVWRTGGLLGEMLSGVKEPQDGLLDIAAIATTTFNPLGKPGSLAQAISPTGFDPFMQIIENKNFSGNPIGPEGFPGASKKANSELMWSSTPKGYQSFARFMNEATGGSAVESGAIDLKPGDYQILVNFLTGSLGRFMSDATFGVKEVLDKDFEGMKDIPVVKEFFSDPYDPLKSQKYHTNIAGIYGAHKLEQLYVKGPDRDLIKLQEVRENRGKELRMYSQAQDVERQIKSLRVRLRAAQNREDTAREKELRDRIGKIQERFNNVYQQRME